MPAQPTRSLILLIVSIICFAIGFLLAVDVVSGSHQDAWLFGGLLAFAAAHLP